MKRFFMVMMAMVFAGAVLAEDAAVAGIVAKAKEKYAAFEKEVKDFKMVREGKIITGKSEMTTTSEILKKGNKSRVKTVMNMQGAPNGMESTVVYDGKDMWMFSPMMGKQKMPEGTKTRGERVKEWWESLPEKATVTGSEKVGDIECFVLDIKETEKVEYGKMWISKKNYMLIKGEGAGKKGEKYTLLNSDFKKVKGEYEMPYKTDISGENMSMSTVVKSIDFNTGLADDLFDPEKLGGDAPGMPAGMPNMQDFMKKK